MDRERVACRLGREPALRRAGIRQRVLRRLAESEHGGRPVEGGTGDAAIPGASPVRRASAPVSGSGRSSRKGDARSKEGPGRGTHCAVHRVKRDGPRGAPSGRLKRPPAFVLGCALQADRRR